MGALCKRFQPLAIPKTISPFALEIWIQGYQSRTSIRPQHSPLVAAFVPNVCDKSGKVEAAANSEENRLLQRSIRINDSSQTSMQ
jgi:hypothetical protein